jgi:hypothetical protein
MPAAAGVSAVPAAPAAKSAETAQPADGSRARDGMRHEAENVRHERKTGRILPWFLQDNESRSGD